MGICIGIDLGTTFCGIAWINPATGRPEILRNSEDEPITPSMIQFKADGTYVCGSEAKEAYENGEPGCTSAFKRHMGSRDVCCTANGKDYTARELSAILLRHLKQEAEKALGQEVTEAVITVPAYFRNDERQDTYAAAQQAGLKVRRLLNEPTAAALNYGLKQWRENAVIMVYDLGGGTFDVTLVGMDKDYQMESIATTGDHMLGGKDWDDALTELVMDRIFDMTNVNVREYQAVRNDIKAQAEGWKKRLSKLPTVDCVVNVPGFGTVTVTISREKFEEITGALLEQTATLCEDVLKMKNLTWSDITDVLLVGGSTRMPQVSAFLQQRTGKKPLTHVNPDEAVALGAAMQTELKEEGYLVYTGPAAKRTDGGSRGLLGVMKGSKSVPEAPQEDIALKYAGPVQPAQTLANVAMIGKRDVQAHGMGVISADEAGKEYVNANIIPPNMAIPVKAARAFKFYTKPGDDNELEVYVLEGDGKPLEALTNDKYIASGIRHVPGGETIVRVQYSFDRSGIIHVQVRQEGDHRDLPIRKEPINQQDLDKFDRPIEQDESMIRSDLTIVLAVDVSGSMSGSPLEDAKKAMVSFVNQYQHSGAKIGVIIVANSAKWVKRPTDDYAACIRAINGIECGAEVGYGNSAHPFGEIEQELGGMSGSRYAIVLADGVWYHQDAACKGAKRCNKAGIETAAIGFGAADKAFLDSISSNKDLSILTQQSELTRSFGKIAQCIGGAGGSRKGKGGEESIAETWETND